jgi:hypothetical protein
VSRLYNGVRLIDRPSPANVRRIDLGCLPLISEMNQRGIYLDQTALASLSGEIRSQMA